MRLNSAMHISGLHCMEACTKIKVSRTSIKRQPSGIGFVAAKKRLAKVDLGRGLMSISLFD